MELKPLSATNDFVFRKMFSENIAILKAFLMTVLDLPAEEYKSLEVIDPNLGREFIEDKLGVLDVKITTTFGKVLNLEIQIKSQRSIWKRLLFYASKMVVEQVKSGYKYDRINRVISIIIADFVMLKDNDACHHRFRLYDENKKVHFPDSIEINVLELPKMQEANGTPLGNWLRFFSAKTEEEYMAAAQTSPAINEAWGVIKVLSGDEQARALAEAREKARMDMDAWLDDARHEGREEGRQEGLQEGRQEGRQEEKLEVARSALRKNMSHADIADLTGLSLEEVKKLAAGL